jgi:hypothetical protein
MRRSLLVVVFIVLGMLSSCRLSLAESAGSESTKKHGTSAADPSAHIPDFAGAGACTMFLSTETAWKSFRANRFGTGSSKPFRNPS